MADSHAVKRNPLARCFVMNQARLHFVSHELNISFVRGGVPDLFLREPSSDFTVVTVSLSIEGGT